MSFASDVAHMLKHAPGRVVVSCNGVTSYGVLDRSMDFMGTGDGGAVQMVRNQVLTVQNGVFPRLREDARIVIGGEEAADGRITVPGVPYVACDVDTDGIDDGELLTFQVKRAT